VPELKSRETAKNNLTMHLKTKQQQAKPKYSRWKEIMKVRAEINELESKRTIERIN
jgi:hypothetical protein